MLAPCKVVPYRKACISIESISFVILFEGTPLPHLNSLSMTAPKGSVINSSMGGGGRHLGGGTKILHSQRAGGG